MRAVANANDDLRGVFTVDWNQSAPDGSGKPLIPNEVVHALIQHFDEHNLSNKSVPPDILGRAYEYPPASSSCVNSVSRNGATRCYSSMRRGTTASFPRRTNYARKT